ncbi:MAG: prepilin-type N-terminal cleavage/methylation domain-containing protein [Alphaproteobacteria bacterium]|nr:prepilin-type N-terminal cleavage/methylation domain-containing protein [Alphaproteobacteria bacterium]
MLNISHPQKSCTDNAYSGFSLVELSVVLVIISLIVGGILAGMNLKHAADLKSVTAETNSLRDTIHNFNRRFGGLPCDLYNATKHWGAADADFDTCKTTASVGKETCNGDGNGRITTAGDGTTYYEAHRFWQHLSNAEMFSGRYTGQRAGTAENATCLSSNHCGDSTYKNGALYPATLGTTEDYFKVSTLAGLLTYPGDKGLSIVLFRSSNQGATGANVGTPLFNTEDAYSLDNKFDDGKPAFGYIQSFEPYSGTGYLKNACATTSSADTALYNLTASGSQCALIFTQMN